MHDKEATPEKDVPSQGVLCPACMTEVNPDADFCKACGAPLTAYATADPLKSIQARGGAWREAAWGRRIPPSILAAMWLILGGVAAALLLELVGKGFSPALLVGLVVNILLLLILCRVTRQYIRHRHEGEQKKPDKE